MTVRGSRRDEGRPLFRRPRKRGAVRSSDQTHAALGEVLEFMRLIRQLDHALQLMSKRMSLALGLTGPQHLVARVVGQFPRITAGAVAKLLHLHPSTLTGVFRRMREQGILRGRSNPRDARLLELSLTRKGQLLLARTSLTAELAVQQVIERIPPEKVEAARDVLRSIAATMSGIPSVAQSGSDP